MDEKVVWLARILSDIIYIVQCTVHIPAHSTRISHHRLGWYVGLYCFYVTASYIYLYLYTIFRLRLYRQVSSKEKRTHYRKSCTIYVKKFQIKLKEWGPKMSLKWNIRGWIKNKQEYFNIWKQNHFRGYVMKNKIILATLSMTFALISFLLNHRFCWNISPKNDSPETPSRFSKAKIQLSASLLHFWNFWQKTCNDKIIGRVNVNTISTKKINKALKPPAIKRRWFFTKICQKRR